MIQFYVPDIADNAVLPPGESKHCCRVLRMREGDEIIVTDGKGKRYVCEITSSNPSKTEISVISKEELPTGRDYFLTLAVAPTKNSERMEWMVEKAVEIGVDRIVLLQCARSERKWQKTERLTKVMISAMNQSLATHLPILEDIVKYPDFVKSVSKESQKFFGYCSPQYPLKSMVKECKAGGEVVVMIGPEGDFTSEEVSLAVERGFLPVTFGNKRLRTETAGVFAVCAVNIINQQSL